MVFVKTILFSLLEHFYRETSPLNSVHCTYSILNTTVGGKVGVNIKFRRKGKDREERNAP